MSVYLIAAIDIEDRETYAIYEQEGGESVANTRAEPLVVDDNPHLLEGALPGHRIVMLRFDTQAELDEWYRGQAYQSAMQNRLKAAKTNFLIVVEGLS